MMKTISKIFSFALIVAFLSGCSSIKVTYDYDKTVDFTKLKTFEYYGWAAESDRQLNDLEKRRIEEAFGVEFKKRGLEYVESDGDMIVVLFVMTENKTQYNATTTGMGYGGYGGYYGYGPGYGWGPGMGMSMSTTTVQEYNYTVGTLVIDIYDPVEERLIWESIGTKTLDDNPRTSEKNLSKSIGAIMAPYPIKPIEEKK
jgi:hypothetical protein